MLNLKSRPLVSDSEGLLHLILGFGQSCEIAKLFLPLVELLSAQTSLLAKRCHTLSDYGSLCVPAKHFI
jgi:hypothetical protein